jgi:Arc/MetJ-type ribon-helix-helix transcriptional regulator
MSKQIAVRLPDEVVEFIDQQVRDLRISSRAAFVQRALEREQRRLVAARDAALLSEGGASDDFDGLANYAAQLSIDVE